MRILHIERDQAVAEAVDLMLRVDGAVPYHTDSAEDGLDLAKRYDFDVILLEPVGLELSGVEILRRLRAAKVATPVMIVSRAASIEDKVRLLHAGADDHLAKPFHRDELVARLIAMARRSGGHAESTIRIGELTISLDAKQARIGDVPVHLTVKEFSILELLALRKGTVMTKAMILDHLYGGMDEPELKIIDVFVCKLRKKLAAAGPVIETVWGRGYLLREPSPARLAA